MMNAGGDTADQMVRMTLQGIEVAGSLALKAGGMASKSLAATLYAILTDKKKVKGKTRLDAMLKSGKELKVFAIRHEDLKTFCDEAKRYGVLFSVLKEKNNKDGICDIMVRAEDAAKISRIVDKFELATIDTKAIREIIMADKKGKETPYKDVPVLSEKEHDELVQTLMNSTKENPNVENPQKARTTKTSDSQFEHNSKKASVAEDSTSRSSRPSVRSELKEIKAEQNRKREMRNAEKDLPKSKSPKKSNLKKNKGKVR